jgi:AraC-like DNA-binding protein
LAEAFDIMKNQTISHFSDVHAHAATVQEWNQDYSQLTAGSTESSLMQLSTAGVHVFLEQINQRVVQHGVAPRGKMCFAVPITTPGSIRMQGREADDSSLFFLQGGEEFMFHMPMGMELLSITFERELFEQALAQTASAKEVSQLLRQPVIRVSAPRFADARRRLLAMFSQALVYEELDSTRDRERELAFEQAMLGELLQLMTDPACDKQQRTTSSTRSFIVEKCHRLATSEMIDVPSVIELCQRLQVSRRTVQNSFRAVAETTPLNYLRSVRLNGVRRTLMSTRASQLSIGDAAAQWGFFHLSHFAAEYQELFAELPSHTPRAAIAACARA